MAAEDGSKGEWHGDTDGCCSILLLLLRFANLPNKRLGGPGNTKVCGYCRCTNILSSQ